MTNQDVLEMLADLLEYPGQDWPRRIGLIDGTGDEPLDRFRRLTESLPLETLQETYTQTFDLNPVAALEIGYHLFGENYKRGLFLAQLRETEARYAIDEARQLPDYLPTLLRLLPLVDDTELRGDLIAECLIPALAKMKAVLVGKENLYAPLIEAVEAKLRTEAPERVAVAPVRELNVLQSPPELNFLG